MVAKKDLLRAAEAIEKALQGFVHQSEAASVYVFESDWGHLRAVVGSDKFKGKGIVDRQEDIWRHLREHVSPEYLSWLYGVDPMDVEEYDALGPES